MASIIGTFFLKFNFLYKNTMYGTGKYYIIQDKSYIIHTFGFMQLPKCTYFLNN